MAEAAFTVTIKVSYGDVFATLFETMRALSGEEGDVMAGLPMHYLKEEFVATDPTK